MRDAVLINKPSLESRKDCVYKYKASQGRVIYDYTFELLDRRIWDI